MKKFLSDFTGWSRVFESDSRESINQKIEDLRRLADLGMIDKQEIIAFIRKSGVPTIIENIPDIQAIVDSPEYQELQARGLTIVSSRTQLLNGNIILGYAGYRPYDGYAIGLFLGRKRIMRMTPKGIPMGTRGRTPYGIGSMDFRIKELRNIPEDQFYRVAMRWIIDHIDLEHPEFPVKNRTRKGYFN